MVLPQRATAEETFHASPSVHPSTAASYQRSRETEKEHLALMARHNLLIEWSDEVRSTVLLARERVHEARAARDRFRHEVRGFVLGLRSGGQPLPAVLREMRTTLRRLEASGAIVDDDGWLEAEVLEWAIEEYEGSA